MFIKNKKKHSNMFLFDNQSLWITEHCAILSSETIVNWLLVFWNYICTDATNFLIAPKKAYRGFYLINLQFVIIIIEIKGFFFFFVFFQSSCRQTDPKKNCLKKIWKPEISHKSSVKYMNVYFLLRGANQSILGDTG